MVIFNGVADEVEQKLAQFVLIARKNRQVFFRGNDNAYLFLSRLRPLHFHHFRRQHRQIHPLLLQLNPPRIEPRQFQIPLHHALHALPLLLQHLHNNFLLLWG